MSKKKDIKAMEALENALESAVIVNDDVALKTEMGKKSLAIISTDANLYEKLLQKFPKALVSSKGKTCGKALAGAGLALSILSGGLFAFIGVPLIGAGAAVGGVGILLDDYKNYSIILDYDAKQVVFIKTKGEPRIELPKGYSMKKFVK